MRISSSNLFLGSTHELKQTSTRKESLRTWSGQRPAEVEGETPTSPSAPAGLAKTPGTTDPGQATAQHTSKSSATADDSDEGYLDAATLMLKRLIEKMFGGKIHLGSLLRTEAGTNSPELPQTTPGEHPTASGPGVEYKLDQATQEFEQMQFSAAGVVKTADGQEISFSLDLQMQRLSVQEQHVDIKLGEQAPVDPLVLNFDGSAAQLSSGTFKFDLQGDGEAENLPLLASGTAFLALDQNHDNQINDGSELFGPASGQGFAELSKYDADHNGWIDENDSVYSDLRLWHPDAEGKGSLSTLAEQKVGAICLQSVATPFTYKTDAGQAQATTSASGVFLNEDGTPGTVQELNYLA
jgi:hypothetical protein